MEAMEEWFRAAMMREHRYGVPRTYATTESRSATP
jgi:hypothetical protein